MSKKPDEFLIETKKAAEVVKRKFEEKTREPSLQEKIRILKGLLEETKDFTQYQELQKEKESLEFIVKAGGTFPFVPVEVQEKLIANRDIEMQELREVLDSKHKQLDDHLTKQADIFEKSILPLIDEILELHNQEKASIELEGHLKTNYGFAWDGRISYHPYPSFTQLKGRDYAANAKKEIQHFLKAAKGARI